MFEHLKAPKDITKYTLMRGTTDFGNLAQYNLYETGYPYLVIVSTPKFMDMLATKNATYNTLWTNYLHILEYEFRGIDGIENITADPSTLTNGISELDIITKVNMQSNGKFSMRFFEKSGSVITRTHELYLRGLKDPRTQFKHYNGLIASGDLEPGYENEVFSFLYFVTDNTGTEIEKAYFIVSAQPTSAETSIYEAEKGTIEFKEITVEFSGFPITGDPVNARAKKVLDWINNTQSNPNAIIKNSNDFMYTGIEKIGAEGRSKVEA